MIKQGAIIWLDLDPQTGKEQKGRRPCIIVSNRDFHELTSHKLLMVCPITNKDKGFILDVQLDERTKTTGVVMTAQTKILDVEARNYKFIELVPEDILDEILEFVGGISRKDDSDDEKQKRE